MKFSDRELTIGNVVIKTPVVLAPLAGVTDLPFRLICREFGCGYTVSEMVSAKGLYYNDKKTGHLLDIGESEHPAAVQIFGSDPCIMAEIVPKVAASGCDIIDINMGCPVPKIVGGGDGSALMKNPYLAASVCRAVSKASPVPVTVKIRAGWDDTQKNAPELAKMLEDAGAAAVAVHGRTRQQMYHGSSDMSVIAEVVKSVSIPVIGNGDIFSAEDAKNMLEQTGCDGVMVARGAQGNPWIFRQIEEYLETGEVKTCPTDREKIEMALRHSTALVEYKGERTGVCESRRHIACYLRGIRGGARIKQQICSAVTLDEIRQILEGIMKETEREI